MFTISIEKATTTCPDKITLTSGMVKAVQVSFSFSEEWENFDKVAVFSNGETSVDVSLDDENKCHIPHEVLAEAGKDVSVGVYGSTGEGEDYVAIPTAKCSLGRVEEGVNPSGEEPTEPTPTIWDEVKVFMTKAESTDNKIDDFSKLDILSNEQYPTAKLVQQYVNNETLAMHQYCQQVTDEKVATKEDKSNKMTDYNEFRGCSYEDEKYISAGVVKKYIDENDIPLWGRYSELEIQVSNLENSIGDIETLLGGI